jgi:RepB DNA-primase from phage plasmid
MNDEKRLRSNGGGQGSYDSDRGTQEGLRMLDLFASVGATAFDITHTNLAGEKRGFRPSQSIEQTQQSIPHLVPSAAKRQNNLIIRPRSNTTTLIQLDDLSTENAARIALEGFLTLQTSSGGTQVWVAVKNAPAGFSWRLKEGLAADREASGAVRMAGTQNFKPQYAPDFPIVTITHAQHGHVTSVETLERMGVLAPEKPKPPPLPFVASSNSPRTHKFPSYERCLAGAPIGSTGQPKRTSADFVWCKTAISWGHSIEDTAARLMQESTKAQENGEGYALQTAQHAEYAARVRNAQPRRGGR